MIRLRDIFENSKKILNIQRLDVTHDTNETKILEREQTLPEMITFYFKMKWEINSQIVKSKREIFCRSIG